MTYHINPSPLPYPCPPSLRSPLDFFLHAERLLDYEAGADTFYFVPAESISACPLSRSDLAAIDHRIPAVLDAGAAGQKRSVLSCLRLSYLDFWGKRLISHPQSTLGSDYLHELIDMRMDNDIPSNIHIGSYFFSTRRTPCGVDYVRGLSCDEFSVRPSWVTHYFPNSLASVEQLTAMGYHSSEIAKHFVASQEEQRVVSEGTLPLILIAD